MELDRKKEKRDLIIGGKNIVSDYNMIKYQR